MKFFLNKRTLLSASMVLLLCYLITLLIGKPRIANDAAGGFVSMYTWLNGNDWNTVFLARDGQVRNEFLSWWAPGQYMIPLAFVRSLGLEIGNAIILSQVLAIGSFIFGYRRLMRALGVDDINAGIALLLLLVARGFNNNVSNFSADIYLLCYTTYYLLAYHWIRQRRNLFNIFILFILSLLGLFIKNSFLIVLFSISIYEILRLQEYKLRSLLSSFIHSTLPIIASLGLFYSCYLQRGQGIDKSGGLELSVSNIANAILKPAIAASFAPFSLNTIANKLADTTPLSTGINNDWSIAELVAITFALLATAILLFKLSMSKIRNATNNPYNILALSFFIGYYILYFVFFLTNKAIYTEDRLFLPLTALLLPYFTNIARKKKAVVIAFLLVSAYSVAAYLNDIKRNLSDGRSILTSKVAIDGRIPRGDLPQPAKGVKVYLSLPEFCLLYPGHDNILIDQKDTARTLSDPNIFLVYRSGDHVIIRPSVAK